MSQYLTNLQRAIAQTDGSVNLIGHQPAMQLWLDAWHEAGEDLTYSTSLSEAACQEHILHWLSQPDTVLEDDKGYYDRIVKINQLMASIQ